MSDDPLKPLDDGRVEGAAGGYLFFMDNSPNGKGWEVIDDKGDVVQSFREYSEASAYARERGYSREELSWPQLKRLRETGNPY